MTPRKLSWVKPNAAAGIAAIFNQPEPPKPPYRRKGEKKS